MQNTEKAIDALMHLLMEYDTQRKFMYGQINTMLNTATYMDQEKVVEYFRERIEQASAAEQKYTITYNLISQAHAEIQKKRQEAAGASEQPSE